MGDFPMMTNRGTFIINGTERVVVSQLVRSPGVLFQEGRDSKTIVTATINPYRGEWIEFDVESKPGRDITAGARVARKRRLPIFTLLRALGYGDPEIIDRFVRHFDFLEAQWEKEKADYAKEETALLNKDRDADLAKAREDAALIEIFRRARPGEPPTADTARSYFEMAFFSPKRYDLTKVGRYKLNRKLGPEIQKLSEILQIPLVADPEYPTVLSRAEILATASYMLHLASGVPGYRF